MKKKTKKIIIIIIAIIMILLGGFWWYVSDYYRADEVAVNILNSADNLEFLDDLIVVEASEPSDTALIFYPGAKVEYTAYLPILEKLSDNGITSVLVKMPFNMAIFDADAADKVFDQLPDIQNWFIGGHSMGGAMASSYASDNMDKLSGLILLGAYIYQDVSPSDALTIYGTFNDNLEKNIDYTENIVIIEGGNHAQFGNYGLQKNDPIATISSDEQQNIAVAAIIDFIAEKTK